DQRLIEDVVPRLESLMRYLKSYGITPDLINSKKAKALLKDYERSSDTIEKAALCKFLDYFVDIFKMYEKQKAMKGVDYADILINFLKIKKKPKFAYVLIDELQDVNNLEARIALESCKTFFAVGDKKQAIFGFQGGSIENFALFKKLKPSEFNLVENHRSTQQILDFAASHFKSRSVDADSKKELEGLKSANGTQGEKAKIVEAQKDEVVSKICSLLNQKNLKKEEKIAILVRTNSQIISLSKELENRNIDFSSTYVASSDEAKQNVIRFLRAIFSSNIDDVKNAFFTPFFPISLQKAFELAAIKDLTLERVYRECREFKTIREGQKDIETVSKLFNERIFPMCIPYGEEYLLAAQALAGSSREALTLIGNKTLENFLYYLEAADLLSSSAKKDAKVTITTVHKAKGLEYDTVIYWPKKTRDNGGFYDYVIEKILESEGKKESVELEEESLRIDFVAFTRAKKSLYVIAENSKDYLNENSESLEIESQNTSVNFEERQKKAYNLFLHSDYEGAKKLLESKKGWITQYIQNHFASIEHISFSRLSMDPYEYFQNNILQLRQESYATNLGSNVHELIQSYLEGKDAEPDAQAAPFFENAKTLIANLKKGYPEFVEAEHKVYIPLSSIVPTKDSMSFKGYIDAIFRNRDNYLLADWKTSKSTSSASEYRRQLELYRRAYSQEKGIDIAKIQVAIGFIGLREVINDGNIYSEIDSAQPKPKVFETLQKHFEKFLEWKANPQLFLEELSKSKSNDPLIRAVIEQYNLEK
ncbi:MAG TPA: ATP-dependent helicase, partial [Candidatus Aquilonibacter sp.]|nr:ATP-dependent helicase [Candidatus Aquilonibacter sp.]